MSLYHKSCTDIENGYRYNLIIFKKKIISFGKIIYLFIFKYFIFLEQF